LCCCSIPLIILFLQLWPEADETGRQVRLNFDVIAALLFAFDDDLMFA
jgi:hypothetical protein